MAGKLGSSYPEGKNSAILFGTWTSKPLHICRPGLHESSPLSLVLLNIHTATFARIQPTDPRTNIYTTFGRTQPTDPGQTYIQHLLQYNPLTQDEHIYIYSNIC
ncbi:hypothetical protein BsWGS_20047 [Bradybaena similaris]